MRHTKFKTAVTVLVAAALSGCAVSQLDVNRAYDAANADGAKAMGDGPQSMQLVEEVPTAFLGDRLVPVAYEATLPAVFREKSVTFPANLPLSKLATLVSSATGYPVRLSPDVFIPREALIPKTGTPAGAQTLAARAARKANRRCLGSPDTQATGADQNQSEPNKRRTHDSPPRRSRESIHASPTG